MLGASAQYCSKPLPLLCFASNSQGTGVVMSRCVHEHIDTIMITIAFRLRFAARVLTLVYKIILSLCIYLLDLFSDALVVVISEVSI